MARTSVPGSAGEYVVTERDRLLRESFALGFVVLLLLVAGVGVLSHRRIAAVEETLTERSRRNEENLEIVFQLQEQTGLLAAEGKTLLTARSADLRTGPVERRISAVEHDLAASLERGRSLTIGQTDEWRAFEQALDSYTNGLTGPEPNTDDVNDNFDRRMHDLRTRVQQDARQLALDAESMRSQAQRDIGLATAVCLLVGLVVSGVAFVETRRRIQQLRRAFGRIAQSRQLMESTLEGMTSAVLTVDRDAYVTRINRIALDVLEVEDADHAVGRRIDELVSSRSLRPVLEPLTSGVPAGVGYLGRFELGPEHRLFDASVAPLVTAGEITGHIVTLTDITDAERANAELQRSRALAAVGQMTAQVAHEIKNPLGGLSLACQLLEKRLSGDASSLDVVRRVHNFVTHLTRIVGELNQFARPSSLSVEPVVVADLLEEALAAIADRIDDRQVAVHISVDETLPLADVDAKEFRKVMINVLINGVDASAPGGRLDVTLARDPATPSALRFEVRDFGAGMDADTQRRLFEPFFTTKSNGTGLGMSITRTIVELHQGTIDVTSGLGQGTSIAIVIPLSAVGARLAGLSEVS